MARLVALIMLPCVDHMTLEFSPLLSLLLNLRSEFHQSFFELIHRINKLGTNLTLISTFGFCPRITDAQPASALFVALSVSSCRAVVLKSIVIF